MKTGKTKKLPIQQAPPRICEVHNEQNKVYCYDCKVLICRDCIHDDHKDHEYVYIKKGVPQVKTSLRDRLVPLRGCIVDITYAVKCVGDTKAQAIKQGASVDAAVKQYCKELLETSAALVQKNVEALSAQEKSLTSASTVVQDLVEFVDQTLENATDEELMEISDQVLKRVDEENVKQAMLDLKPVDIPNVHVRLEGKDKLVKFLQQSTEVYIRPSGPGLEGTVIGKPSCVHVFTVDENPAEVKASLKSLYDESVVQFNGKQKELRKYEIVYTPKIRGRHELVITVNGIPVYNKPLFVRIPPTQLSKPVRVISNLKEPWGVAIDSAQEVLVSEFRGVQVIDKHGQKLRSLEKSKFGFQRPTGIAVDMADDIYVADASRHCISKISKGGKLLKVVGKKGSGISKGGKLLQVVGKKGSGAGELDTPGGLTVIDNQLYVCERGQNNRIQVFSTELEFIRMFGTRGKGNGEFDRPQTIAVDQDGLLYISDYGNSRIQVVTKQGEFVRSFSGQLGGGHCLCIVGQYLYVADCSNNVVSVLDKDSGKFVSLFGKGDFKDPNSIFADADGFIYVCGDKNLLVF